MTLLAFDHVNIRTANLQGMIAFYRDVLGLREGRRPNFDFPGAWLYLGDRPFVHLVGVERPPPRPDQQELALEHFAFSGRGMAEFVALLEARGIEYWLGEPPGFDVTQVNFRDPDGNHIHVDFPTAEAR